MYWQHPPCAGKYNHPACTAELSELQTIATSQSWEHQAVIQNLAQRTEEDEEGYSLQLGCHRPISRNISETLPMVTEATNLARFEQAITVGKDYLYVHKEKASP